MSLSSDKSTLKKQITELKKTDDDARDINTKLRRLEDAITADIQCDLLDDMLDALSDFYDNPAASMSDSNINDAIDYINAEIRTIEAVQEARRRAKEALEKAAKS